MSVVYKSLKVFPQPYEMRVEAVNDILISEKQLTNECAEYDLICIKIMIYIILNDKKDIQ